MVAAFGLVFGVCVEDSGDLTEVILLFVYEFLKGCWSVWMKSRAATVSATVEDVDDILMSAGKKTNVSDIRLVM